MKQPQLFSGHISSAIPLKNWYFNATEFADAVESDFFGGLNTAGLPVVDFDKFYINLGVQSNQSYGVHVNPVTLCQYALGCLWRFHATHTQSEFKKFLRCADWLCTDAHVLNGAAFWLHRWIEPQYHLPNPWVSAMAQGEAISVLLRAFEVTGSQHYLEYAHKAFQSFFHQSGDFTCTIPLDEHSWWFAEYPGGNSQTYVLNGHIFALLGIYDYFRFQQTPEARQLWHYGLHGLRVQLSGFDNGYWTWYDSGQPHIAATMYHTLHILQLEVLDALLHVSWLPAYIQRWSSYSTSPYCRFRQRLRGIRERLLPG